MMTMIRAKIRRPNASAEAGSSWFSMHTSYVALHPVEDCKELQSDIRSKAGSGSSRVDRPSG
jgi:hypothetical protein